MSLQGEYTSDYRRVRRRMRIWRLFAVIGVIAAVFFALSKGVYSGAVFGGDHIARITISGLITDDLKLQKLIEKAGENKRVKAVILRINSPGGTTTGSEALFEKIRKLAEKKPVVAVLGTVAASGGYITAIAADYIVARGNTITGSIGVIFQWAQITELLDKVGVKFQSIKSAPLKATPNPFEQTSPEARKAAEEMVRDAFDWFVKLVAERRSLSPERARELADGRVYTGRIAARNKLVDEIGGEDRAVTWLTEKRQIKADLEIVDWRVQQSRGLGLTGQALALLLRLAGLGDSVAKLGLTGKALSAERLSLDGLVSVWQPDRLK